MIPRRWYSHAATSPRYDKFHLKVKQYITFSILNSYEFPAGPLLSVFFFFFLEESLLSSLWVALKNPRNGFWKASLAAVPALLESLFIKVYNFNLLTVPVCNSPAPVCKVCESATQRIFQNRLHTSISWGEMEVMSAWKHQWTIKCPLSTPSTALAGYQEEAQQWVPSVVLRNAWGIQFAATMVCMLMWNQHGMSCVHSCFINRSPLTTVELVGLSSGKTSADPDSK